MEVGLVTFIDEEVYFKVTTNNNHFSTSREISRAFNLDIDTYNKILAKEVIQHGDYRLCDIAKDLIFDLNNTFEEVYIDRFKEAFTKQLILLALGGINK